MRRAGGVVALISLLVLPAACTSSEESNGNGSPRTSPSATATEEAPRAWSRVAPAPLSARWNALGGWTGREALFVGGSAEKFHGLHVPLYRRDGAAFDPATGTWRSIADAPQRVGASDPYVMADDRLVVAVRSGNWLVYDSQADRWDTFRAPPRPISQPRLSASGNRVYVLSQYSGESSSPVQILNLDRGTWSALPPSPHRPLLDMRTVVATPAGVVVIGDDLSPRRAGNHNQTATAEVWNGSSWRRYPKSHVMGNGWYWTGTRIITPHRATKRDSAKGGLYTFRAGALDPSTGTWSRQPWLPAHPVRTTWELAGTAGPVVLYGGYLYDDTSGTSTPIPRRPPNGPTGGEATVITQDNLIVFGGYRVPPGQASYGGQNVNPMKAAWMLPLG